MKFSDGRPTGGAPRGEGLVYILLGLCPAYDGALPAHDDQISLASLSLARLVSRAARPTLPVRRTLSEAPNLGSSAER